MSAHTPGPWSVGHPAYRAEGVEYVLATVDGRSWPSEIAVLYSCNKGQKADARLIAAAPDLLAACKAVMAELAALGFYGPEHRLLADAIAKAEDSE